MSEEALPERAEPGVTVGSLIMRFKLRIVLTTSLVLLESVATLLFPLFIGLAINGLLRDSFDGVIQLGVLTLVAVVLGSARRAYDTRAYSSVYAITATELVAREQRREASVSVIAARTKLLAEFVQFLEGSLPGIATSLINLVGTLIILAMLSLPVFWGCLALFGMVIVQYWLTGNLNYRLNAGFNDELEAQVEVLASSDTALPKAHFERLMRWSVKLSDLETANYAVLFLGVVALLVLSPVALVDGPGAEYGFILAALMYVLQYVEDLAAFPLYAQELIRLGEISERLRGEAVPSVG